jgi:hypothetical protein
VLSGKLPLVSDRSRGRRAGDRPAPPADAPARQPLLVLRQSRLFARALRPETIAVYGDRVEHARPGLLARTRTVTVRYEQVAQVSLDRRLVWSALAVDTTGGGGFVLDGLRRRDADAAKAKLDRLIGDAHARESVAEALERLSRLREQGLLTDFEFHAAKGAVFRNAA